MPPSVAARGLPNAADHAIVKWHFEQCESLFSGGCCLKVTTLET